MKHVTTRKHVEGLVHDGVVADGALLVSTHHREAKHFTGKINMIVYTLATKCLRTANYILLFRLPGEVFLKCWRDKGMQNGF